ncbi:MAG: radical SAM family heme chaperone HemW [Bacteroidales bacterium]|nr:radical SAM family heme chaperone HemW [Bacteroidales bacterium]MCM1423815.1 radical SAM family heme chaperone HemW [bacterium]
MKELSLYIHIPFCVKKCRYCDFLSFPVGVESYVNRYVNLLCREIALRAQSFKKYQVISVFFGGGTPSLLAAEELGRIMETVRVSFALAEDAEITVECNPGTVTQGKLENYITHGINRLSIGLQSADNWELARIGRIHDYETFLESCRFAREAGFQNINIDLMSALPGQTLSSYQRTLERVCALSPEHISAYSLMLEEGTKLYVNQKEYTFPDEDEEREMYYITERVLSKAGYRRYEISNYALPGRECRHNQVYWKRGAYLGLGLGASSMIADIRWKNPQDMADYRACVEAAADTTAQAQTVVRLREMGLQEVSPLTEQEQMEEFMFLGLRMTEGVSEADFLRAFGVSVDEVYGEVVARFVEQGLLRRAGGRLFLTPRGIDVSNVVSAAFLF